MPSRFSSSLARKPAPRKAWQSASPGKVRNTALLRACSPERFEQANLTAGGQAIIISSTWVMGDPPDNAANFWSWLESESAPRLENLRFAVLGLATRTTPSSAALPKS